MGLVRCPGGRIAARALYVGSRELFSRQIVARGTTVCGDQPRRLLLLCLISVVFRVWWCFQPSLHLSHHFLRRVFVRVRLQKVVHQTEQIEIRRFFVFVFSSSSSSLSLLLPIGRRGSPLFFWTRRQSRRHDLMSKGRATHTRFLNTLFFLRGRKKKRVLLMI